MNNRKTTSKTIKSILFVSIIAAMILPFSAVGYAEAQIDQAEKTSIKNSIEAKMQEQVRKDQDETRQYTSDEYGIPYNLVFEDNGKLIVGIDIEKAQEFTEDYSVEEVKSDLQTSQDIEVNYYGFDRESNPVATKVYGGSLIKKSKGIPNTWEDATITLVKNGKIITTGHLATKGTTLYMACGGTNLCTGTVSKNPISSFQGADAALITTSSQFLKLQENKIKYGSKTYSVTDGVQSDIKKYGAVKMAGTTTPNSSGNILDTDVRVKDTKNNITKVLTNQVIANYPSAKGDSGAPIFITTGSSTAKIIGQHVGKFCLVDLNSVATSNKGYGQWCTNTQTGEGALTVFTPWPAVKSNLGI